MPRWALPEFVEDALPLEAARIEGMRRRMLDRLTVHGYELVIPPLLEYVESLLTGTGHDLDLDTFKLVDQLSGRMLGLRADITPQAARIDAHLLNSGGITRLCYAGHVVRTLPTGLNRSRESMQLGAELFGHAGIEGDIEIQRLMLDLLRTSGLRKLHVNLGHIGVFRALATRAKLPVEAEDELFQVIQSKDLPALRESVKGLPRTLREALILLPELYGDMRVLEIAKRKLPEMAEIRQPLAQLARLARATAPLVDELHFDLAELRGYRYHSGMVFSAFVPGWPTSIARGGRYDDVGLAFGRARPATGFSLDLREVAAAAPGASSIRRIRAPACADARLDHVIARLRARGNVVVQELRGQRCATGDDGCTHVLRRLGTRWIVQAL